MVSKIKKRFIENILSNISYSSFSPHLGIFSTELISNKINETIFKYKIPSYLCRKGNNNNYNSSYLSTSATIALFDEFSSIATIIHDKNSRSGVSIVLTAENYTNILPNTEVLIVSKSLKIGKTIGFSELQMFDTNNNLVATGSHIKYLDMGKIWDIFMQPAIFPYIVNLLDSSIMKNILLSQGIYHHPPKEPLSNIDEIGSIYPLFNHKQINNNSYNVTVQPHFMNPNKTFHGGAVAMSAEESVILSNPELVKSGARVKSMKVEYLSPMIGDLIISTENINIQNSSLKSTGTIARIDNKNNNNHNSNNNEINNSNNNNIKNVCANFTCNWS